MGEKLRILIVDSQEDWLNRLRHAFPDDEFEALAARSYDDAQSALDSQAFALAVVDPTVDNHREEAGDGLETLIDLMGRFPAMPVIVVTESGGQTRLDPYLAMPRPAPLMQKHHWDEAEFLSLARHLLAGEPWKPPEPEITLPPDLERAPAPYVSPTQYVTGPLPSTGTTGPLPTGLMPPEVGARIGQPRVLIVEDSPDWQDRFAQLMEAEGYFWRVSANYDQAMERLKMEGFHVVLLDLMLGESDIPVHEGKGWLLLDYLAADSPKTKVIIASGDASRNDVARLFMRYPIKGFVDKDVFDEAELLAMVHQQLGGPRLRIQTLGDFRIWRDGKAVSRFGNKHSETIIKILLTRRGEGVSVDELIECLWPGSEPKAVYADLGTTINSARSALEPDLPRPNDSHFIQRSGANYMFNFMANVEVDVESLRRLVSAGRQYERSGELDKAMEQYQAARDVYQGDYLPGDRFAQWAIQERTAAQSLYTEALNRLADLYAEDGRLDLAIEAATKSLQVDAYIESTYRRLMRYHTCQGNRKAAGAVYRSLVKLFSEFFGEEPSEVTQRLHDDIQAGRTVICVEVSAVSGEWRLASDR
jgi:DNA-binding SARP family transcriptional activator/CheY-like chemotaxis protein